MKGDLRRGEIGNALDEEGNKRGDVVVVKFVYISQCGRVHWNVTYSAFTLTISVTVTSSKMILRGFDKNLAALFNSANDSQPVFEIERDALSKSREFIFSPLSNSSVGALCRHERTMYKSRFVQSIYSSILLVPLTGHFDKRHSRQNCSFTPWCRRPCHSR